jgi:hypothetical protein
VVVIDPLLGLDVSIKVWIMLVNRKDCGKWTWCRFPHDEDLISFQHHVVPTLEDLP